MDPLRSLFSSPFLFDGDTGAGDGGSEAPAGDGAQGSGSTGAPAEGTEGSSGQAPAAGKTYTEDDVRKLRGEAADWRTKLRDAEKKAADDRAALLKALGVNSDGSSGTPTVEQLQETIQRQAAETRQLRTEAALGSVCGELGLKANLTRALLVSEGILAGLDPAASDFASQLKEKVAALAAENPELKVSQGAARGGSDMGSGGGAPGLTQEQIARMTPEELDQNWPAVSAFLARARA